MWPARSVWSLEGILVGLSPLSGHAQREKLACKSHLVYFAIRVYVTLAANVACGHPSIPASIGPVCEQSPSMDCFPSNTRSTSCSCTTCPRVIIFGPSYYGCTVYGDQWPVHICITVLMVEYIN